MSAAVLRNRSASALSADARATKHRSSKQTASPNDQVTMPAPGSRELGTSQSGRTVSSPDRDTRSMRASALHSGMATSSAPAAAKGARQRSQNPGSASRGGEA